MANDEKPGTNLASGSVVFVALVSTGFYFFHREAPLVDMRPVAEARLEEHAAPQEVEARLWQDPIESRRQISRQIGHLGGLSKAVRTIQA